MTISRLQAGSVLTFLTFSTANLPGQVATPNAGLTYQGLIPVPRWTTAGATAESVDLSSFNPVTQVLY